MSEQNQALPLTSLDNILQCCHDLKASDIHLSEKQPAAYRVNGGLERHGEDISKINLENILAELLKDNSSELPQQGSLDFAYSDKQDQRYRINAYKEMGRLAIALRFLDNRFSSLGDLHLPPQLTELVKSHSGLVLVCGATGSGKSTTLAALINQINQVRAAHILTIEDPVEFIHKPSMSVIHQRELGKDFDKFPNAVKAALREDPDVLMVGELRDLDTIRTALTAAETGHLVFSTLHTNDAVSSIERLIGAFPGNEQDMCRVRLSRCLRAVIAQRLIPTSNKRGRIPAVEILLGTQAAGNLIENNKTRQLYSIIESGGKIGMQTMDQSLANLVQKRWITLDIARHHAKLPGQLPALVQQIEETA